MKKENGFTLVEIIVALFIGSLMMVAIYSVINSAQRTSTGIERKVIAQQDARSALELMAMEIRMASYNPTSTPNIWVDPADCFTIIPGNQIYRGIQEATANSITIEMDVAGAVADGDGAIAIVDQNEIIRYSYDTNENYITRSTSCGAPQPFLGALAGSGVVKTVNVINSTAGAGDTPIPVFRYYNGAGTDISATVVTNPASITLGIPAIRRIEMTLAVETENVDPTTNTRKRLIYSTSVIPRNHISPTYVE